MICFDSLSSLHRSPVGAVAAGTALTFSLRLSKRTGAHSPRLIVCEADRWDAPVLIAPMTLLRDEPGEVWYTARFTPQQPSLLFYRFDAEAAGSRRPILRSPGQFAGTLGNYGGEHWQLTVFDPHIKAPPALSGGLIYQILPDRFFGSGTEKIGVPADRVLRSDRGGLPVWRPDDAGKVRCNDYFGGDLEGIRQKLPYLQSLGVTAIYLNPIFEAHSNHRYNTADYEKIDPLLGGEEDFKALCAEAKAMGIAVILDGVFSHTGSDSVYFNREGRYGAGGAARDPESPYRRWYRFEHWPDRYKSWWGIDTLPDLEETELSVRQFFCGENGVIARWMRAGASGWRLDVADELPDAALGAVCAAVRRSNPDAAIIGEVWEDASNKVSYGVRRRYLLGNQLSSVMNYPLTDAILGFVRSGDSYGLYQILLTQLENYPAPIRHTLMNSLSTHDIPRAITALAGEQGAGASREWQAAHHALSPEQYRAGKRLFRLASVLQYTLPGTPCLYYGDEAGLCGYRDPFNRTCHPWEDGDQELTAWFAALGALRRDCADILADGEWSLVEMDDAVFSFLRRGRSESLFVAVNRLGIPRTPLLPPDLHPAQAAVLLGNPNRSVLPGFGALILRFPNP